MSLFTPPKTARPKLIYAWTTARFSRSHAPASECITATATLFTTYQMNDITTALAKLLKTIDRAGDYYAFGRQEVFMPSLEVTGVGPIALPLLPVQAQALIAAAERAPYGRGAETLVDTDVRRTWQIDASQVKLGGRHWQDSLNHIVKKAAEGLGVTEPVSAEFYKLLVYDTGSFFVSHRDTEKAAGMFATLVIVLPSRYTGGELIVRHQGQEACFDLGSEDPSEIVFAAFYADCLHEVQAITSGCRLTLIYNLLCPARGAMPVPPDYSGQRSAIVALLKQWEAGKRDADDRSPEKLVCLLEHVYTPAELAFETLKGADVSVANVLLAAAEQAQCEVYLALMSVEESGSAEYVYYGSYRRHSYNDDHEDEFEIGEVFDRDLTLKEWRRPDGIRPEFGAAPFEESELCPPLDFETLEPDQLYFQEATGNAGASFERTYQRAALVLWPKSRRLAVMNQAGLNVTLPYLDELAQRCSSTNEGVNSPSWREAHDLSGHMIRTWPKREAWSYYSRQDDDCAKMLLSLARLKDVERIDAFLQDITATGTYAQNDNQAIVVACMLLPSERASKLLKDIVEHNAPHQFGACCNLLSQILTFFERTGNLYDVLPAASRLIDCMPGASQDASHLGRRLLPMEVDVMVDLLSVLMTLDDGLAQHAVDHALARPVDFDIDKLLIPTALRLGEVAAYCVSKAGLHLRDACLKHLAVRIAEPLEAPQDWCRANVLPCQCADCRELATFLADPETRVWHFKAAEAKRSHVQNMISNTKSDIACTLDQKGRPYTLVCTKNQASYERRVKQRQLDLHHHALLDSYKPTRDR